MAKRKYSAKFKFQVVMELLRGQRVAGQVARAYGVHPITLGLGNREKDEKANLKDGPSHLPLCDW